MVLLIQALLMAMVAVINIIVVGVFHGPWWLAALCSLFGMGVAWLAYLVYQGEHPEWWPPWDEGLPREMRMMNAFVPVLIIYVFFLILVPVFERAKHKAQRHRQQHVPTPVRRP